MTATAFDTLEFVESLEASGFTKEQSRGMAGVFKKAQDAQLQELATKGDIALLRAEMRELKLELMSEIKLNRWMLALVVASTVIPALKTLLG
ncbi:MAG: CCDC90 family protein [Magnetococcus sp. DMHC-8]